MSEVSICTCLVNHPVHNAAGEKRCFKCNGFILEAKMTQVPKKNLDSSHMKQAQNSDEAIADYERYISLSDRTTEATLPKTGSEQTLEASNRGVDFDPACPACFKHISDHTNPTVLPVHFKCRFCGTTWENHKYNSNGLPVAASTLSEKEGDDKMNPGKQGGITTGASSTLAPTAYKCERCGLFPTIDTVLTSE